MKLYTEEEIKKTFGFGLSDINFKGYMNAMTPIELPSDEEIDNACIVETNKEPNDVELLAKVPIGRFFLALGISALLCLIIPLVVIFLFNYI